MGQTSNFSNSTTIFARTVRTRILFKLSNFFELQVVHIPNKKKKKSQVPDTVEIFETFEFDFKLRFFFLTELFEFFKVRGL